MGKKSKDPSEDVGAAVKSLFGADNPFRRNPQPTASGDRPQPATEIGLGFDPRSAKKESITETAEVRKRRRGRGMGAVSPTPPSSTDVPVPRKRKKLMDEDEEGEPKKKKKKRKRDEVEAEYEKMKYSVREKDEAAAAVVAVGEKRKAADAAAEMFETTKESSDDEDNKLLRTVFVGNLPLKTKRKVLLREFAVFGEIDSVRIRSVPLVDTKAPRRAAVIKGQINEEVDSVNAYIVFKDEQSAHAALAHNMTQIGGKHIRVDMACPPRKKMKGEARLYDRKRTVFVGNLPFDVKDEELYQLFCGLSQSEPNVQAVRVIRDPHTSIGKGFAYVLFKTRDAANSVCRRKDLKIRDRILRVYHAKLDATTSKGKEGPSRDFPHKRLASVSDGETPYGSGKIPKTAAGASPSYQGLRSNKKDAVKKTFLRSQPSGNRYSGSTKSSSNEPKGRKTKRPAVAARKAKQLKKRKQMSSTPENIHRYKRARHQ